MCLTAKREALKSNPSSICTRAHAKDFRESYLQVSVPKVAALDETTKSLLGAINALCPSTVPILKDILTLEVQFSGTKYYLLAY